MSSPGIRATRDAQPTRVPHRTGTRPPRPTLGHSGPSRKRRPVFSSWKPALVDRRGVVVHRADQAELVRQPRQLREQLAQVNAGHLRLDRAGTGRERRTARPASGRTCRGGRPADHVDEDARLRCARASGRRGRAGGARKGKAGGAGGGGAEEVAAGGGAVGVGMGRPRERRWVGLAAPSYPAAGRMQQVNEARAPPCVGLADDSHDCYAARSGRAGWSRCGPARAA